MNESDSQLYEAIGYSMTVAGALGTVVSAAWLLRRKVMKHPFHPSFMWTQLSVGLVMAGRLIARPEHDPMGWGPYPFVVGFVCVVVSVLTNYHQLYRKMQKAQTEAALQESSPTPSLTYSLENSRSSASR